MNTKRGLQAEIRVYTQAARKMRGLAAINAGEPKKEFISWAESYEQQAKAFKAELADLIGRSRTRLTPLVLR